MLTARLGCGFSTTELQRALGNITGGGWKRKMQNNRLNGVLRHQKKLWWVSLLGNWAGGLRCPS
jgi:hypothetical protein